MGRWGPGVFDSDCALDFVWSEVKLPLLRQLEYMMANPTLAEADEGCDEILVSVELLSLLCEHAHPVPPEPAQVALWKETFLTAWDRTAMDLYTNEEFMRTRRQVISDTFDRLAAIATAWHSKNC